MKLLCKYILHPGWSHLSDDISPLEGENDPNSRYDRYLCAMLGSDFQSANTCDMQLKNIAQLETGEVDFTDWGGNAFFADYTRDGVQIYLQIDEDDDAQTRPEARFTLAEVKAALIGWREFLQMPESLDTRLVIELTDEQGNASTKLWLIDKNDDWQIYVPYERVYIAAVEMPDLKNPEQWIPKAPYVGRNTMFPKDWDEERLRYEVEEAWKKSVDDPKNPEDGWLGETPSGVLLKGYKSRIIAFPLIVKGCWY